MRKRANEILKNGKIDVPSKNFWRSLETALIKREIEIKSKWVKFCVLSVVGVDNENTNPSINFTINDSKLCVPLVTLSARENKKLSKCQTQRFGLKIS